MRRALKPSFGPQLDFVVFCLLHSENHDVIVHGSDTSVQWHPNDQDVDFHDSNLHKDDPNVNIHAISASMSLVQFLLSMIHAGKKSGSLLLSMARRMFATQLCKQHTPPERRHVGTHTLTTPASTA